MCRAMCDTRQNGGDLEPVIEDKLHRVEDRTERTLGPVLVGKLYECVLPDARLIA